MISRLFDFIAACISFVLSIIHGIIARPPYSDHPVTHVPRRVTRKRRPTPEERLEALMKRRARSEKRVRK
jgi:hypothetical protein